MLLTELSKIAYKWKEIGLALGFESGHLSNIQHSPLLIVEGVIGYLRELIQQWLAWTPPDHDFPTLSALNEALVGPLVDEPVLAEALLRKGEVILWHYVVHIHFLLLMCS